MSGIKRDKRDRVFSDLIRTRDQWTCQRCGTYYPGGQRQGLHCSHFYVRRNKGTRWDEDNCVALCFGCHQLFGEHLDQYKAFMLARLGHHRYDALARRAKGVTKFRPWELELLYTDMKKRLADLQKENHDEDF